MLNGDGVILTPPPLVSLERLITRMCYLAGKSILYGGKSVCLCVHISPRLASVLYFSLRAIKFGTVLS